MVTSNSSTCRWNLAMRYLTALTVTGTNPLKIKLTTVVIVCNINLPQSRVPAVLLVYVLDCKVFESKIELQSCYYVHYRNIKLVKVMTLLIPSCNGLASITTHLLQGLLWYLIIYKG